MFIYINDSLVVVDFFICVLWNFKLNVIYYCICFRVDFFICGEFVDKIIVNIKFKKVIYCNVRDSFIVFLFVILNVVEIDIRLFFYVVFLNCFVVFWGYMVSVFFFLNLLILFE